MYVTGCVRCTAVISNTSVDQLGVYPFLKIVLNLLTRTLSLTWNFARRRRRRCRCSIANSELRCALSSSIYDIIILVETWLNDSFTEIDSIFTNFLVYRLDRNSITSQCARGGGVLIAVRNTYRSQLIVTEFKHIEQLYVLVRISGVFYIFGSVYIAPASNSDLFADYGRTVANLSISYQDTCIYLIGDYNLPRVFWIEDTDGLLDVISVNSSMLGSAKILCDLFNMAGLLQHIVIPNCYGSFLDLMFTNDRSISTSRAVEPLLSTDSYHPPLQFEVVLSHPVSSCISNPIVTTRANFKAADYVSIINHLNHVNWDCVLDGPCVDSAVDTLYAYLNDIIGAFVPHCTVIRSSYPRWYSKNATRLIRAKEAIASATT